MSPENNSASIIIPAFNEEEGIEKVFRKIIQHLSLFPLSTKKKE